VNDLRALTLIRPMSAAIVHGSKRIENRPQNLPKAMRGRDTVVAVHAGKGWDAEYLRTLFAIDSQDGCHLPYGGKIRDEGIVGLMLLSGRVFYDDDYGPVPYVDGRVNPWFSGPYGYEISAAIAFPAPIPCRGMLGFWRVPTHIEEMISMSGAYDDLYRAAGSALRAAVAP